MRRLATAIAITCTLGAGAAHSLVIYRFGGDQLPPPPEADSAGVEFVQRPWADIHPAAGGEALDLDLSNSAIGALECDPAVDIAPTIEEQGGMYVRPSINAQVWDHDTSTVWTAQRYLCAEFDEKNYFLSCTDDFGTPGTANIDLGGLYQIDHIRVVSGLRDPAKTAQAVRIFMDLEMPFVTTTHHPPPFDNWLLEVRDNREQILDIPIPPHEEIGFIQMAFGEHDTEWEIHDVEVYAKGYVQRSTYTSDIIDFGSRQAWGELTWSGAKGERAKVSIQTRSGQDDDPTIYWRYTGRGTDRVQVTKAEYAGLKLGERAGTSHDQENWSFWSTYAFEDSTGTQIVSPSPRQFLQFQVTFLPLAGDGGHIDYLEFRASEPLATDLVGEVWPVEARVGATTEFTYVLRPTIGGSDTGFDRIEIQSLSLLGAVRQVRVADEPVAFTVEIAEDHRFVVSVPRMDVQDSGALVEIVFDAQILRFGSRFEARVTDSSRPLEVPQGVAAGDATGEYEGNTVAVETATADEGRLLQVRVAPEVATPNGDGVNDAVEIDYEIFEITGSAATQIEVWDLSGRRVRLLVDADRGVGTYKQAWDGTDDSGQQLPPGIYPYSISVDTDRERVRKVGLLYVAY